MGQAEKMQALKDNPQQQKMLNTILEITNDAIKKEFPVFAKLVQADVSNAIMAAANKEGQIPSGLSDLHSTINELMVQVGKDLEKNMMNEFQALKEQTEK